MKDKKLCMEAQKWLVPIDDEYKPLQAKYCSLELNNTITVRDKSEAIEQICLSWLASRV